MTSKSLTNFFGIPYLWFGAWILGQQKCWHRKRHRIQQKIRKQYCMARFLAFLKGVEKGMAQFFRRLAKWSVIIFIAQLLFQIFKKSFLVFRQDALTLLIAITVFSYVTVYFFS